MILRCEDPSFYCAASIKSVYSTKPVGLLLQSGGFVKGSQVQPQKAINTIVMLLFVGTVGLLLVALWQALTFHLNKRTHRIFVEELDRLKAGGLKQNVTPQARHIVEDLTGHAYDTLWSDVPQPALKSVTPTSSLS